MPPKGRKLGGTKKPAAAAAAAAAAAERRAAAAAPPRRPLPRPPEAAGGTKKQLAAAAAAAAAAERRAAAAAAAAAALAQVREAPPPPVRPASAPRRAPPPRRRPLPPPPLRRVGGQYHRIDRPTWEQDIGSDPLGDIPELQPIPNAPSRAAYSKSTAAIADAAFAAVVANAGAAREYLEAQGAKVSAAFMTQWQKAVAFAVEKQLGPKLATALAPIIAALSSDVAIISIVVVGGALKISIFATAIVHTVVLYHIWKRGDMIDAKTRKPISRTRMVWFLLLRIALAEPRFAVHLAQMLGEAIFRLDGGSKGAKQYKQFIEDLKTQPLSIIDRITDKKQDPFEKAGRVIIRMRNLSGN